MKTTVTLRHVPLKDTGAGHLVAFHYNDTIQFGFTCVTAGQDPNKTPKIELFGLVGIADTKRFTFVHFRSGVQYIIDFGTDFVIDVDPVINTSIGKDLFDSVPDEQTGLILDGERLYIAAALPQGFRALLDLSDGQIHTNTQGTGRVAAFKKFRIGVPPTGGETRWLVDIS